MPGIFHEQEGPQPESDKVKCLCGRTLDRDRTTPLDDGRICKQCGRKKAKMAEVDRAIQEQMDANHVPSKAPEGETIDEGIERLSKDSEAFYAGRCAPDLYPVFVSGIDDGRYVRTSQPERPPVESFNFVQEHQVQIYWEWEEDGEKRGMSSTKEDGPDYGVPFIEQCPFDPFIGRARARARWGMQDAHPENRGFMALPGYDGRTYYGDWSEWSEWFTFTKPQWIVDEENEIIRQRLAEYNTLRRRQGLEPVEAVPDDESRSVQDLRVAIADWDTNERDKQLQEVREQNEARNAASLAAEAEAKERAAAARARMDAPKVVDPDEEMARKVETATDVIKAHYFYTDGGDNRKTLLKDCLGSDAPEEYGIAARNIAKELGIDLDE